MVSGCAQAASLPSTFAVAFRNLSLAPKRNFSRGRPAPKTAKLPSYIPPYPYGPRRTFKQADNGLYGGSTIQFGNKISKGKNKGKTRRTWHPNIHKEKVYSNALEKWLTIKVQHRVRRTINKVGGLDEYLLGNRPARIKELGIFGWHLRWQVMMSNAMRKRFADERKELQLDSPETFGQFLNRYKREQQVQAAKDDQATNDEQKPNTARLTTRKQPVQPQRQGGRISSMYASKPELSRQGTLASKSD